MSDSWNWFEEKDQAGFPYSDEPTQPLQPEELPGPQTSSVEEDYQQAMAELDRIQGDERKP